MTAIIQAVLAMLTTLLPLITSAANANVIESIVTTLANMMPSIVTEAEALVPIVKNIIAALSGQSGHHGEPTGIAAGAGPAGGCSL